MGSAPSSTTARHPWLTTTCRRRRRGVGRSSDHRRGDVSVPSPLLVRPLGQTTFHQCAGSHPTGSFDARQRGIGPVAAEGVGGRVGTQWHGIEFVVSYERLYRADETHRLCPTGL